MSGEIILLGHDMWMHDSNTKTCLSCELPFTTFRRRHHCRYCGKIYCGKCATKKNEKISNKKIQRICAKCYTLIKRRINSHTPASISMEINNQAINSFREPSNLHSTSESHSSIEEDGQKVRLFTISEDVPHEVEMTKNEINAEDGWGQQSLEFLQERTNELIAHYQIQETWHGILVNLIQNIVSVLTPSVQFRGDFMEINKYLKVQKIIWNSLDLTSFMSGIAFVKNLANKKMLKKILNPKILFLNEVFENFEDSNLVSMDKLIDQEGSLSLITLKKILSINPSMIICSKSLPQVFLAELSNRNITALINVKKKLMDLIARATCGKILNTPDEIYHERNFLGQCNMFVQENRGSTLIDHFTGLNDLSLVGTVFISGPDAFELNSVKKIIRELVIEYRSIRLERMIFVNYTKNPIPNVFNELNDRVMIFKHFLISENKMCLKPEILAIEFYKEKDMALGEFLLNAAEKTEQHCRECGNSWGAHTLYYLKKGGRIKITFSKSSYESKSNEIYYSRECKVCGNSDSSFSILKRSFWEYSFYKLLNNFFQNYSILCQGRKCKHDFFKLSKLIFHVKNIKIIITWEENPCYHVLPLTSKPDVSKTNIEILQKIVAEIKSNSLELLDSMFISYREISNRLIKDIEENKKYQDNVLQSFTWEIEKNLTRLTNCIKDVNDMNAEQFENFLYAQAKRKELFLEICEIRMQILNSLPQPTRGRRKDKLSLLGDNISSSGGSSGETKKSPSPNPSIATDEEGDFSKIPRTGTFLRMLEKVAKVEDFCLRKDFIYMQKGNQTLPLGHNGLYIPIEENDLMSIIAYSLSSEEYYEEVLKTIPTPNDTDKIESELLSAYEKHFQHNFTTMDDEIYEKYLHKSNITQLFGHHITFNVHSFFPRQFHIIRSRIHTSYSEFLMGISCSDNRELKSGKSGATFTKSISNMYILKNVDEKEFNMFKELAPSYFRHFCNSELHNMPSLMIRTLGCYRVYTKNHTLGKQTCKWVMLFENLGCSMPAEVAVYDLKGSFNTRRLVNGKEKMTKMDRNFLEDFGGLPITISKEAKKILEVCIWNDTLFLSKHQVVDYSLLLIVSTTYKVITMAIIDYIAKYTFEKALEHNIKKIVSADNPTITKPTFYKNRFRESVSNSFFLELDE
ncbi:hypothetical protein SteCoe_26848 [Stentor coeruleus]|uniref:1-phosphatidylinositol-3-phosphate 5-kinase n=1 Tax=Stentor coeruleus TaxID=5963 RepID=A0A1R2BBV4_9CILI|nr:hypothetical protein SteCoe_33819 [Stentor coeruleus]OMJ74259.1 hypothetical protein SteCoe_26848 [Stentor coeruleus]